MKKLILLILFFNFIVFGNAQDIDDLLDDAFNEEDIVLELYSG